MQRRNIKSFTIFAVIFALALAYLANRYMATALTTEAPEEINKYLYALDLFISDIVANPLFISLAKESLLASFVAVVGVALIYIYNIFGAGNYMHGEEYGSSRFAGARDIKPFVDTADADNNILFTATEKIRFRGQPKDPEYDRNKNVLIVGGSGSGKTRFYVKPNLCQMNASYVVTDPKGTLFPETAKMFIEAGYKVKVFNTIDTTKSLKYNPLKYIHSELDILKVVNVIIENTNNGKTENQDFWVKAERLLYSACIGYLYITCDEEDRTIPNLIRLLSMAEAKEEDEEFTSELDELFDELEEEHPGCFASLQYAKYKQAAGKTAKSILISCGVRLAPYDISEIRDLMSSDDLELEQIGDRKTILYLIMSDTNKTFNFITATLIYQMTDLLCARASTLYGGKLPVPVRCIFDEFANVGVIPEAHRSISVLRSRGISWEIILQSISQLNADYKDNADTITDNCDTLLFLGGKGVKTLETLTKMIGKATINNINISESRGQSGSNTTQNQTLGRDLMDAAEIARMKRSECLLFITGLQTFRSKKYDITKHPRYSQLADRDDSPNIATIDDIKNHSADNFLKDVEVVAVCDMSELNSISITSVGDAKE